VPAEGAEEVKGAGSHTFFQRKNCAKLLEPAPPTKKEGLVLMEKVKVGLIGTGTWGNIHAQTYTEYPRAALAAVCDLNEERARKTAAQYGVSQVYTDYRKMLKDGGIDAVAIVTPDFAHREIIEEAALAGKHIIVEKPLATTHEDLARIAEAVTKARVKFMVDFHNRWNPPLVVAKNDIEHGKLGDVVSGYLRLNNTLYVPLKMLAWSSASSILWFLGSHAIDTLRYLFQDEIVRVYSVSRSGVLRAQGLDVPDIYQTILEFRNGPIATVENHWIMPDSSPKFNDFKVNILGSKGMLNMDLTHNQLIERYLSDVSDRPDVFGSLLTRGHHVGFVYESIKHFVDCVADGKEPEATLDDGVRVSKVILAMMESARVREPVKVIY
jgi:predicted dehydrogenase